MLTQFASVEKRRAAWSGPPGGSVEGFYFYFWWKSLVRFSVVGVARNLFAANASPLFVSGIHGTLQLPRTRVSYEVVLRHTLPPRLRFRDRHRHRAQRPHRKTKGNPQGHRQNHPKLFCCSWNSVPVHDVLQGNHNLCLPKLSGTVV